MKVDGNGHRALTGRFRCRRALVLALAPLLLSLGLVAVASPSGATVPTLSIVAGTIGSTKAPCASSGTAADLDLGAPDRVATDTRGDLYIADPGCYAVYKVTPQGVLTTVAGIPGTSSASPPNLPALATSTALNDVDGVAVDAAGDLFLSSANPSGVYEVQPDGTMTNLVPSSDVSSPGDIAVDSSGDVYVTSGSSLVLKISGGAASDFYEVLAQPVGLATDSAGNVYITITTGSFFHAGNFVDEVSSTGAQLRVVAGSDSTTTPASTLSGPEGVAVDASGNVFIADTGDGQVDEVTPSGAFSVIAGSGLGTPSTSVAATASPLYGPDGVAVDPFGNLYIADTNQGVGGVVEELPGVAASIESVPGTPTISGGGIVLPWSAVTGATSYTVTIYVNGVAQTPITGLTGLSYTLAHPVAGASYAFTVTAVVDGEPGPTSALSASVTVPSPPSTASYWTVAADGGVFSFGSPFYGSAGDLTLNQPVVAVASTADGRGYWAVAKDGGIFAYGDAVFHGSVPALGKHVTNIVGIAADTATGGYWVVGSDGGVYAFGAPFDGSVPGLGLHLSTVVGIADTADGGGYYLVTSTGAVYAFGDAKYQGGANTLPRINAPVVGITVDSATGGYWLAGSDGGIYAYGAPFHGSAGGTELNAPVVGISATTTGSGYYLVASDGGVFSYDAPFLGSMGGKHLNAPMAGIVTVG